MLKMLTKIELGTRYAYPGMAVIITTRDGEQLDAMASGWHSYIGSDPEMYGFSGRLATKTYELLKKARHLSSTLCQQQPQN